MGLFRFDDQHNIVFGLWLFRIAERGGIPVPETIPASASVKAARPRNRRILPPNSAINGLLSHVPGGFV
jgi:hypothetical protein